MSDVSFNAGLNQQVYDRLFPLLELQESTDFVSLRQLGDAATGLQGSVRVFHGQRVRQVVFSEFSLQGSPYTAMVIAKPDTQFALPQLGIDYSVIGEHLHIDTDLFPVLDLAEQHEYFQQYYAPHEAEYTDFCKQLGGQFTDTLWFRNYCSPLFFMTNTTADQADSVQALAMNYLDWWLQVWQAETTPVAALQQQRAEQRLANFSRLGADYNPIRRMFTPLLGEATVNEILQALYA